MSEALTPKFGLYLHWPFCAAKCPYCDFNSHVVPSVDYQAWQNAFEAEIRRVRDETGPRVLSSIFFGGGTPSLMPEGVVEGILRASKDAWAWANDIEITLEANPSSIEIGRFRSYAGSGVNRVSMGVQALNDTDLKKLGRLHSVSEAMSGLDVARSVFDRVSIDLIYARQDQSLQDWQNELDQALGFNLDHMSLYQLTIEDGTAFGARHKAGTLRGLPDEDLAADMYDLTQQMTFDAGFSAYEVSNHAKTGAKSIHNQLYWTAQDWAGIGPGAHGRLTIDGRRFATETALMPQVWLERIKTLGHGETVHRPLALDEITSEYLLMSLRMSEGASLSRLKSMGYTPPSREFETLAELDFIEIVGDQIRVTSKGRPLLNRILTELAP